MSFRSALSSPSPSSGGVGTVIKSAALNPAVPNVATAVSQFLSPITLSAGTWIVTSSVQIISTAAAAGFQYVGIGVNGAPSLLNYYTDTLFTTSGDFVISSTNVLELTADSTIVTVWVQASTAVTTQTYGSWASTQPLLTATKIA